MSRMCIILPVTLTGGSSQTDDLDVTELARAFGSRGDISARSVLVTIFGDSVVPSGGEIWLGDLIDLCEPFGFSDRLVRTSMFRLTAEDWFETERVGRRSHYRLTATATAEFAEAEARIYHRTDPRWDHSWTTVFLDTALLEREQRESLTTLLRWRGYAPLSTGVLAVPRNEVTVVRRLAERSGIGAPIPVAVSTFGDLDELVGAGWLRDSFGLDEAGQRYRDFIERHGWTMHTDLSAVSDVEAFLLRTMIVHDIRRPRLADPDLPADLLPTDWPASAAFDLAGEVYRHITERVWAWLTETAGLSTPDPRPNRFPAA